MSGINFNPVLTTLIPANIHFYMPELTTTGAAPILDETGNKIIGEENRNIYEG